MSAEPADPDSAYFGHLGSHKPSPDHYKMTTVVRDRAPADQGVRRLERPTSES